MLRMLQEISDVSLMFSRCGTQCINDNDLKSFSYRELVSAGNSQRRDKKE